MPLDSPSHSQRSEKGRGLGGGVPGPAIIVLAAGLSRRFGTQNKLLIDWEGEPLIRRVVKTALATAGRSLSEPKPDERSSSDRVVIVVTGHEAKDIEEALADLPVIFIRNEHYLEGMGTSIAAGVKAAPADAPGFLIVPGDMPRLSLITLAALAGSHLAYASPSSGVPIATCRASWGRTAPTFFNAEFRLELERLEGDSGARSLLKALEAEVWDLAVDDAEVSDID